MSLAEGAPKLYFTCYSDVVIKLFNTGLCYAFSTDFFWKKAFRLSLLLNAIVKDIKTFVLSLQWWIQGVGKGD